MEFAENYEFRTSVVCWTAVVNGLGIHGQSSNAMEYFHEMLGLGVIPDENVYLVCSFWISGYCKKIDRNDERKRYRYQFIPLHFLD